MSFLCRRLQNQQSVSLNDFSEIERTWLTGSFAKVCCRVNSDAELLSIYDQATTAGIEVHLITDSGKTEFHGSRPAPAWRLDQTWRIELIPSQDI